MHEFQVTPSKELLWGHACNISLVSLRNTQSCSSGLGDEMEADTRGCFPPNPETGKRSSAWVAVWVGGVTSPTKQTFSWVAQASWKIHVFKYKIQLAVCSTGKVEPTIFCANLTDRSTVGVCTTVVLFTVGCVYIVDLTLTIAVLCCFFKGSIY